MFDSLSNYWDFFISILSVLPNLSFFMRLIAIILLIGIISFFVELIK